MTDDAQLDATSRALIADLDDIKHLEIEKRGEARSTERFHDLAEDITDRTQDVRRIADRGSGSRGSDGVDRLAVTRGTRQARSRRLVRSANGLTHLSGRAAARPRALSADEQRLVRGRGLRHCHRGSVAVRVEDSPIHDRER
jgi:hypothetical protein